VGEIDGEGVTQQGEDPGEAVELPRGVGGEPDLLQFRVPGVAEDLLWEKGAQK
jgi:hypothetical protein